MISNELRLIIQNRLNSIKTEYGIHEISYRTAFDEKMFPHVVYDFSDVAPADMGRLDYTLDVHIWDKNQYTAFQIMDAIRERIALMGEEEKAPEGTVRDRLEQCRQCDHLVSGLCGLCGCYVELRAAKRHMRCPDIPKKW